jgi:hypothetical protein
MKHLIKKISTISLVFVSFLLINSCEESDSNSATSGLEDVVARFTRVQDGKTITFINISENATSYLWDFGDGTTSTIIDPVKKYTNGSYTVTLTAKNGSITNTFEDNFIIDGCSDETTESLDPANDTPLNMTFLNANGNSVFDAFGNIGGGIVNNPVLDNVNSSCNVFSYNKLVGCETWSGAGYLLNTALDFSTITNKVFKVKVLATTQVSEVTLLLERLPFPDNNPFVQRVATITQVGEWQELTFDFSDVNSGTFKNMIIYFERGAACDGDVYYFDDIIQTQQ